VRAVVRLAELGDRTFAVQNVSLGGALITSDTSVQPAVTVGDMLEVAFFDPNNPAFGEIRTRAQVVRCGRAAIALQWIDMSPKLLFDLDFMIGRMRK
jgi:hypothetical protein